MSSSRAISRPAGSPLGRITNAVPAALVVVLLTAFVSLPLYSMVVTAFKTDKEIYDDFSYIPRQPTLIQFQRVIVGERFFVNIQNSLIVATTATVVAISMSVLAAFAVVRLRFRGRVWVARLILFKYLLPTTLIYIPLFLVVNGLGLANTLQSLIFTYLSFSIPFATWLLMGYFRGIPAELEEQAMIDGCSRIGAMIRVLLPLAAPGVVAASIFTFTGAWNEFLLALVFINRPALQTVPVKLSGMIVGDQYVWGAIMAGAILASLPVVLLYFLAQRFVVAGLAAGAVKG
ncbi:MAG: carbohydrate ABC transporter permease [Chloroflexi bacterium]|nr:carbohydrate ABC transporter permease [Chloroflexota bacterium]